jgi:hypothetical protein
MGIIQNALNQMIGTVGIATKLMPNLEKQSAIKQAEKAYNVDEQKLAEAESSIHGRSGHKQYQNVIDANKQVQASLAQAQRLKPTLNRSQRLDILKRNAEELELRRKDALESVAKRQEAIKKQKEESKKFAEMFTEGGLYK